MEAERESLEVLGKNELKKVFIQFISKLTVESVEYLKILYFLQMRL